MQQRYYDPWAGRFLSVDPVTPEVGGGFNRYVYGNNNPYKFKDPDGRFAIPLVLSSTLAGAAAHYVLPGRDAREQSLGNLIRSVSNAGNSQGGDKSGGEVKSPEIKPSDVAGKTAGEIGKLATDAGLTPKGPDPVGGKGEFVDPKTGEQRVLVHGDHAHVNDSAGNRLDVNGNKLPANAPEAYLPVKPEPPKKVD